MERAVVFNKVGYDPFIDFIKAYAIICVLLGHTFPYLDETGYSLWYGMQVPFFVLIQVFHTFKKDAVSLCFRKIAIRVLLPYVLVQTGIIVVLLLISKMNHSLLISQMLTGGGIGPGSYYPWIYLQFALLLPLIKPWFDKGSKIQKAIILIAICEGLEIAAALIHLSDNLYRLLAVRYLFLIDLGWIWVNDGIVLNIRVLLFSLFSIMAIVYFEYFYVNTEPWFYDTAWRTHRWPCYFYVATLLSYFLYVLYRKIRMIRYFRLITTILARCSYEIFLMQMAVITLFPSMSFISNPYICFFVRFTLIWVLSIAGGYCFNIIYNKIMCNLLKGNNG